MSFPTRGERGALVRPLGRPTGTSLTTQPRAESSANRTIAALMIGGGESGKGGGDREIVILTAARGIEMRSTRCKITFFNFYFQNGSYQLGTEITFQITNKRVF